ncbi:hypothetical protein MMC28_010356 [Mycoblastus sanguinarius]|nr:hypothetical protein [Mycoblastus sanguinarius]
MFTGDKPVQVKAEEKGGKISDWFKGESEPISIGILPSPTKEKADPLDTVAPSSEIRPTSLIQKKPTAQVISKTAMASRFSFFSTKASLAKSTPRAVDLNDELIELNIGDALFPAGPPDPFSPAAFKNLQQNAEGLLLRLQTAYKDRTAALREMTTEKETLAEEMEGTETRAKYHKMQLDDMSVKLAEQDEAMMNLVDELAQEKLARREEEEARKRSFRLVERMEHDHLPTTNDKRTSRSNTISDSGFESEDDSSANSVFSRRHGTHSPTMSMSSVSTTNSPDGSYQIPEFNTALSSPQAARLRVPPGHSATKSLSASYHHNIPEEPAQSRCANCDGVRTSEAWSVVDVLKEENTGLKQRVGELEGALDGCLDVVGCLS